jgi:hypothetical protein
MSNITLHVDLGQDNNFTTTSRIESRNTRELGRFVSRIDINQCFELRKIPTNNVFNVKLIDNLTNSEPLNEYEYVIKLNFERIE